MECTSCLSPFDSGEHLPKILIKCGHTLCTSCIRSQLPFESGDEDAVELADSAGCPECGTLFPLSIALKEYPVNLALVALV